MNLVCLQQGQQGELTSKSLPLSRLAVSPTSNFICLRTKLSPQQSTLISLGTNLELVNASSGGFPNVSATGTNCMFVVETYFTSVISLVNDRLIKASKPMLAWLSEFVIVLN